MTQQAPDLIMIYKQLQHIRLELQIIERELARIAPMPEAQEFVSSISDLSWKSLHEAEGLWEREWDAEWKEIWEPT
jgi:hypothetical protein